MLLEDLVKKVFRGRSLPKKAVFRLDAGRAKGLSYGHLFRCMLIAGELKRLQGTKVVFLMRNLGDGVSCARSFGYNVITINALLSKREHDKVVAGQIERIRPDYFVVDLPFDNPNYYLDRARREGVSTVCIDDLQRYSPRADVILNSSILADRKKYRGSPPDARFLLGMEYFPTSAKRIEKKRRKRMSIVRVLVTFGGSDPAGLTEKVADALKKSDIDEALFTITLGPGFKGRHKVVRASRLSGKKAVVINYPKDLRGYFRENDLVVCAGGTTLYELNVIGKPCIAIASTGHESDVVERFRRKGLIMAGLKKWDEKLFLKELKRCAMSLLK